MADANKDKAAASRLHMVKNKGKDQDEMRRRRTEVTVELRKNKRDDTLNKKRNVPNTEDTTDDETDRDNLSTASLETIVERAQNADPSTQLAAVQAARKLLSSDRNPPIDASSCPGSSLSSWAVCPLLISPGKQPPGLQPQLQQAQSPGAQHQQEPLRLLWPGFRTKLKSK